MRQLVIILLLGVLTGSCGQVAEKTTTAPEFWTIIDSHSSKQCSCMKTPLVAPWSTDATLRLNKHKTENEAFADLDRRFKEADGDPEKNCNVIEKKCRGL